VQDWDTILNQVIDTTLHQRQRSALNRKMLTKRLDKLQCVDFEAEDGDVAVSMVQAPLRGESQQFDIITMDNV
jgi:CheY-like chemotaxis protein